MALFSFQSDGSVLGPGDKVLYFSIDRFVEDICNNDACFICGDSPNDVEFNNEHILPQWILRKFNLHAKYITLPNQTEFRYDQYTIPCCAACNSLMSEQFETPISLLIDQGYNAVIEYIKQNGSWLFFVWLCLIFMKTHLKDNSLRMSRDRRVEDVKIGDLIEWEAMHHIHCISRSFYTGCDMEKWVMGSFYVLPAKSIYDNDIFDFVDLTTNRTVLLKLGDIAFIAVLADYCAAINMYVNTFNRITGPLSVLQLREFAANCAYINQLLKERADYVSYFDTKNLTYKIRATIPQNPELEEFNAEDYGTILYTACSSVLNKMVNSDIEEIKNQVKSGRYTFLFDESGNFITNSMEKL